MRHLLFFLLALFTVSVSAITVQDSVTVKYDDSILEPVKISEDDLKQYRSDSKFDYTLEKADNSWWEDLKNWAYLKLMRLFGWIFGGAKAAGYLAVFLRLIPYVLLGLLIFILIKFFLKVNAQRLAFSSENKNTVSLSEEEHIIKNEDIQQLIKNALADKNYRLAVRYYYLHILKLLSEKELIDWQLQKTNVDYEKELSGSNFSDPFQTITRLYDYVWYGGFEIDETKYKRAETEFSSLQNTILRS